jgi:hypothetical protein
VQVPKVLSFRISRTPVPYLFTEDTPLAQKRKAFPVSVGILVCVILKEISAGRFVCASKHFFSEAGALQKLAGCYTIILFYEEI